MMEQHEIILVSITGDDRPGVTFAITEVLGSYGAEILDIGQADIHHSLSLGILFRIFDRTKSGDAIKELLFKATELGVGIRFSPVSDEEYQNWVNLQGQERYIVTLLGRTLTALQVGRVTRIIAKESLNIDSIKRLTGRIPLNQSAENVRSCIELSVRGNLDNRKTLQKQLMQLSAELNVDISFQVDNMFRRNRRLICFDMDSTLIKTEVIDELADWAGVGEEVRAITELAMRGEIDFQESFTRRVALLEGVDESVLQKISENMPIMEGADKMMSILKQCGFKIAILSGGFTYFGEILKKRFGADYVYANELEIVDGKLTGRYLGDVVDGRRKAELLRLIAQVEHIDLQQTIAVGDGANDLPMINLAGLGIAFHAKPKVKESAGQSISTIGLDGILYFLGFRDIHIENQF
jgi:phosphoserine phosphatase